MEIFTEGFFWQLLGIIFIDLALAGDNAMVIGLAAANLPAGSKKKAIIWGTGGAIIIRALATILASYLLTIPALKLGGGLLLIAIAYKLTGGPKGPANIKTAATLPAAVRTIIIADGIMGLDNVMGVVGVAHGNLPLAMFGLLLTVPVIVWGSTIFANLVNRYPVLNYLGVAILAWAAGSMITEDPLVAGFFHGYPELKWLVVGTLITVIVTAGYVKKYRAGQLN